MQQVLKWFRQVAQIPHVSGNEKALSDWLVQTAQGMGLQAEQDEALNVIIRKGAGRPVILQGHMDMVGQKDADSAHDFAKDPIRLVEKDGMLSAEGTTLGADDGMAVAMTLALLAGDDPALPALEVLLTTGEEVGLVGASALASGKLKGNMMLNLDGEEEGVFLTSCAGGETVNMILDAAREQQAVPCLEVGLTGFRGGHSGLEIDKGRLNAARELACWLRENGAHLAGFEAPGRFNAISGRATAWVTKESAEKLLNGMETRLALWRKTEADAGLVIKETAPRSPLTAACSQAVMGLIISLPDGVYTFSKELTGLVESSSNLGVVEEEEGRMTITASIRSSEPAEMEQIERAMRKAAAECGASVAVSGAYPGWAFEKESALRDTAVRVWRDMFGAAPQVTAVHGGLECGVLKAKYPDVSMLSFGPTLHDVHTPREHVELASVERVYRYLKKLLAALK